MIQKQTNEECVSEADVKNHKGFLVALEKY